MKFPSIKIDPGFLHNKQFFRYAVITIFIGMLGNLLFSFFTTDRNIFSALNQFRPLYFALAVVLSLMPWITNTLRLMIWTRFLGKRFSLQDVFKIILGQDIGSAVSPTAIGGGYVKAGMLIQKGMSAGAAASLMTLGTVEDGVFFMVALPAAFILSSCWKLPVIHDIIHHFSFSVNLLALVVVSLISAGIFIYLLKHTGVRRYRVVVKIVNKGKKVWKDFWLVYSLIGKRGKTRFAVTMLLTAVQWISRYSVVSALLASLNRPVDPVLFFLFQWITFTMMTMIPTPGAAAGAEVSFYFIYTPFIPKEFLGLLTLGWRFLTFYLQVSMSIVIFAVICFLRMNKNAEAAS